MNTWLWILVGYVVIGVVIASLQLLGGVLSYPRVMTKGGIGRALRAIPNLYSSFLLVVVFWFLIPLGWIVRRISRNIR